MSIQRVDDNKVMYLCNSFWTIILGQSNTKLPVNINNFGIQLKGYSIADEGNMWTKSCYYDKHIGFQNKHAFKTQTFQETSATVKGGCYAQHSIQAVTLICLNQFPELLCVYVIKNMLSKHLSISRNKFNRERGLFCLT